MADVTAGAARYASVAEVRAGTWNGRAATPPHWLCGFGRCLCFKTALGISGGKERGHWPQFQESERSNRVLLGTAIAAFDSLESGAKDSHIRRQLRGDRARESCWIPQEFAALCGKAMVDVRWAGLMIVVSKVGLNDSRKCPKAGSLRRRTQ